MLARAADWISDARAVARPTRSRRERSPSDILVNPHPDLPRLEAVITTPVFDADWRLVTEPGYHRDAGCGCTWTRDRPITVIPGPTDAAIDLARPGP